MEVEDADEDFYALLGVSRDATLDEVKKAYRKRAKQRHSDQGGDDDSFIALTKAYDTLSDPSGRRDYDRAHPPKSDSATDDVPYAEPYVTPSVIDWILDDKTNLEPVAVRLSNRAGMDVTKFGPELHAGTFWRIEHGEILMDGEDLAEYVITPTADPTVTGHQHDKLTFYIDDRKASIPITLYVAPKTAHRWTFARSYAPDSTWRSTPRAGTVASGGLVIPRWAFRWLPRPPSTRDVAYVPVLMFIAPFVLLHFYALWYADFEHYINGGSGLGGLALQFAGAAVYGATLLIGPFAAFFRIGERGWPERTQGYIAALLIGFIYVARLASLILWGHASA